MNHIYSCYMVDERVVANYDYFSFSSLVLFFVVNYD